MYREDEENGKRRRRYLEIECAGSCKGFLTGFFVSLLLLNLVNHRWIKTPNVVVPRHSLIDNAALRPMPITAPILDNVVQTVVSAEDDSVEQYEARRSLPILAACFGGSPSFRIAGNGESVRRGVLVPLQPDVFIAGTLNGSNISADWPSRSRQALASISALGPFAGATVEVQPSTASLKMSIERSGFMRHYKRQISSNGAGRLNPSDDDPRLWLPTMLSPALGNPSAHTLREFHYQSRCLNMIRAIMSYRGLESERLEACDAVSDAGGRSRTR